MITIKKTPSIPIRNKQPKLLKPLRAFCKGGGPPPAGPVAGGVVEVKAAGETCVPPKSLSVTRRGSGIPSLSTIGGGVVGMRRAEETGGGILILSVSRLGGWVRSASGISPEYCSTDSRRGLDGFVSPRFTSFWEPDEGSPSEDAVMPALFSSSEFWSNHPAMPIF